MMKLIDQETIDFAEDFFFKLSDAQVKERVEEFKTRQGGIHLYVSGVFDNLRGHEQRIILWQMTLMIDHCFNIFYGKLLMIRKEAIIAQMKSYETSKHLGKNSGSNFINLPKLMEEIGQNNLIATIGIKLKFYDQDLKLFTKYENEELILTLMSLGYIYQNEIKKRTVQQN
ncbi:MAG: hypothetical protein WCL14_11885 [Bacteroidota bacterium]